MTDSARQTKTIVLLPLLLISLSVAALPDALTGVAPDKGVDSSEETQERSMTSTRKETATEVFDFGAGAEAWPNIDDPVMGGLSRSRMRIDGDVAIFEGIVSLANNGGFASLRSRPAKHDLGGYDGVTLRIRGDGKTYGLRLRTDANFDGVSYQVKITTEDGRWQEARLPFAAFEPVFRGREVRGYPVLDPSSIRTFGWIISDKQEGPFRLEIDWLKAYRDPGD